jgi:F0F1-type ATP synthase epsilon subunit
LEILSVTIKDAHELIFEGNALSVSSINEKGQFDILPYHINFISIISSKIIIKTENGSKKEFVFKENAVIKVEKNIVKIYLTPAGKVL